MLHYVRICLVSPLVVSAAREFHLKMWNFVFICVCFLGVVPSEEETVPPTATPRAEGQRVRFDLVGNIHFSGSWMFTGRPLVKCRLVRSPVCVYIFNRAQNGNSHWRMSVRRRWCSAVTVFFFLSFSSLRNRPPKFSLRSPRQMLVPFLTPWVIILNILAVWD